jgi:probable rRNA maturation factor
MLLYRRAGNAMPRREFRAFAERLRDEVAGGRHFTCLITDDRELTRLNRMFLNHDYPTDVLSFPSGEAADIGEIAISIDRARDQAADMGHSVEDEVRILMLHGVLHLLGYDHEKDRGKMAREEKRRRAELGLPAGLIERSKGKAGAR